MYIYYTVRDHSTTPAAMDFDLCLIPAACSE